MKNISKRMLVIIVILTAIIITGCSSAARYQDSIFDDEEKIISDGDSYTYKQRIGNNSKDKLDIKYTSFSGMETIYKITTKEESEITFDFESEVEKGDFKAVLIMPDDQVINIINGAQEGNETLQLKEGTSRLKLVGSKAKGHIKINIKPSKDIEIKKVD